MLGPGTPTRARTGVTQLFMRLLAFLPILACIVQACKRKASRSEDEDEPPQKIQRIEDVLYETQIDGENLIADIWFSIFLRAQGGLLHSLSLVSKAFNHIVMNSGDLETELRGPSGALQCLSTRQSAITRDDRQLVKEALAHALEMQDVSGLAKMLVRSTSDEISRDILDAIHDQLDANTVDQVVDQLVLEYGIFAGNESFPKNMDEFEDLIVGEPGIDVCQVFDPVRFLYPCLSLCNSECLSTALLQSELSKRWLEIRTELNCTKKIPSSFDFIRIMRQMNDKKWLWDLRRIGPHLNHTSLIEFTNILKSLATIYCGVTHNDFHVIFRHFCAQVFHWTPITTNGYFASNLVMVRDGIANGEVLLVEVLKMAVAWNIPLQPILENLQKWEEMRSIKVGLRRKLEHHRLFLENIKNMDERFDPSNEDVPMVAALLPLLVEAGELHAKFFTMFQGSFGMFCVLKLILSGDKDFYRGIPDELLTQLTGWRSFGDILKPFSKDANPILMLSFRNVSHISRMSRLIKTVGSGKHFTRALCMDICHAWIDRKYAEDVEEGLTQLPPSLLRNITKYMRERLSLPAALYLSNADAEFAALFPSIAGLLHFNEDELASFSQETKQKSLKATAKLFNLKLEEIVVAVAIEQHQ